MRQLRFRIWNGVEMIYDVTVGKFGTFYVNPSNNGLDPKDSASLTPFTTKYSDDIPVMQFTGLLDKNGKEIYEGDILSDGEMIGLVWYDAEDGLYDLQIGKDIKHGLSEMSEYVLSNVSKYSRIIGNVYENPKLIEI